MTTLTITAKDLRDLLTPVLPFAGKDGMLPILTGVNIQGDGHTITATTTDRFRLAICRHVQTVKVAKFEALIRARDVRRILALFRANRLDNPRLRLVFNGTTLKVSTLDPFAGMDSATLTFSYLDGEFPKANAVIRNALNSDEPRTDTFGLNPAFLADFQAAVRTTGEPLAFRSGAGEGKPLIVMAGDHFIAALMPRRLLGGRTDTTKDAFADTAKGWMSILGEPEAAAPKKSSSKKTPAKKSAASRRGRTVVRADVKADVL